MQLTPAKLPEQPYDFSALEPHISAEIMELHYSKHHAGYVKQYNAAMEKLIEAHSRDDLPETIRLQPLLRFNGGGHINHSFFWPSLAPRDKGGDPQGQLAEALTRDFGSVDTFKQRLSSASIAIQGSGWGWLGYSPVQKHLVIATCANQDPLSTQELIPLLGIDVWEHAYYLQYKNVRADYVQRIWEVIYWKEVERRYREATKA